MEEKKLKVAKKNDDRQEPTYEELKDWCNQLMMQRNQVAQRFRQVTDVVNKLPWLFEVVKTREAFTDDFVIACINEIESILLPPEVEEETKEEETEESDK